MRRIQWPAAAALGLVVLVACSGNERVSGFENGASSGGGGGGGGTSSSGGTFGEGQDGGPGKAPKVCAPDPANYDVPGNNCDDDGDGTVDNPPTCDDMLAENGGAEDFARALGICTRAADKGYGLVSATYTRGYGRTDPPMAEQHGILPKFGNVVKPREGKRLGVLSTGYAQEFNGAPGEPFGGERVEGFRPKQYGKDWYSYGAPSANKPGNGTAPPGFPKPAANCQNAKQANDVINVKLEIKAPPNASGVKFDFNFYSGEWPAYICSSFNDSFIAYLTAKGFNGGKPDNMSFDKNKNPVSVNNGFFDRCTPNVDTGCAPGSKPSTSQCPGGTDELGGTGFGIVDRWCAAYTLVGAGGTDSSTNGGATGWLTSQAPVEAGETFTLEFMIWDTGDAVLDSSVLLDNFTWVEGDVQTGTARPPR